MLLFVATPKTFPQTSQESIATPTTPAQTQHPKLSMVWRKEFDGKRERMVAHWVIDQ